MQVDTQRMIDRVVGTFICRLFSVVAAFRKRPSAPGKVRRILIILLSEMGSLTLAYPMMRRLAQKYPDATLSVLTFERNREIIDILGYVDNNRVVGIRDISLGRLALDSCKAVWRIRRYAPDAVIDGELFSRISSIYSFLSKAPVKAGFYRYTQEGLYRGTFMNRPVLYNPYLHISRQFVHLAEALDDPEVPKSKRPAPADKLPRPTFRISSREKERMANKLESLSGEILHRPLVVLHPGGGLLPIRAWPPEHYCTVAVALLEAGYSVIVTGPAEDRELGQMIVEHCATSFCTEMIGETTSIRELLAVFSLSRLLVTNDGGPGHFAGLTGTPAIILYGPETPLLYGALSEYAVNLFAGYACSPCLTAYNHRRSPCNGNNLCLQSFPPETVLDHAFQLLKGTAERETGPAGDPVGS